MDCCDDGVFTRIDYFVSTEPTCKFETFLTDIECDDTGTHCLRHLGGARADRSLTEDCNGFVACEF